MVLTVRSSKLTVLSSCNRARNELRLTLETEVSETVFQRWSTSRTSWLAAVGPGLLFAGAAVGVSHLVQSTRGGAQFGLAAITLVLASCVLKFPAFRFGPLYASATGTSLLDGYRRRGRWTLVLFGLLTLAICFTTLAAVTIVTAGLLISLVPSISDGLSALGVRPEGIGDEAVLSILLLVLVAIVLASGGYRLLERLMKFVVPVLAICTLVAMALALRSLSFDDFAWWPALETAGDRSLAAAIVGWMPAPIDIAVWSSLWTLAKARGGRLQGGRSRAMLDFDIGYVATMILAIAFVVLGAAVMHGRGEEFSANASEFATQVVDLYGTQLGPGFKPLIAIAAFLTMLSTTVTVADGFPRAITGLVEAWRRPVEVVDRTGVPALMWNTVGRSIGRDREDDDPPSDGKDVPPGMNRVVYWISFVVVAAGAMAIPLGVLSGTSITFKGLIDVVTISSFVVAPVLVLLNHLCVTGEEMPPTARPGLLWRGWSWTCFGVTAVFAGWYLVDLLGQLGGTAGG